VTDDGAAAFADLYIQLRRFASVVRSFEMDADDLIQEALVRTLARHALDELDDPAAFLRTVIVRLASNDRRSAGRRRLALGRIRGGADAVRVVYPSDTDDLWQLEPADRAAVYLAVVEQRSHREIAEVLGCSEEASRKRVSRALVRLKRDLAAEADNG
jgi:DNA-directed RNA polymerase specialized sigma24 family protein